MFLRANRGECGASSCHQVEGYRCSCTGSCKSCGPFSSALSFEQVLESSQCLGQLITAQEWGTGSCHPAAKPGLDGIPSGLREQHEMGWDGMASLWHEPSAQLWPWSQ